MTYEFALHPGDIVSGLEPSELVEIRSVSPFGSRLLVVGVGLSTSKEIKRPLLPEEAEALSVVRQSDYSFDGDPAMFLLGVEAERIRVAHQFDPLFAVSSSVVDVLPHQVEAVYRYLLPLPRIRFLLADDTGAGKTIMAGLLIKELLFRGAIEKILIVTPGGLTKQWKEEELQERFGLHSRLVNRASFDAEPDQFARTQDGIFIVSIDFLSRNEPCLNAAGATQWDLIVVDEAHKLSAYEYGQKLDESSRYKALKLLSQRTDHLLFLTATPHRGRKDTFRRLLMLLDEDLFRRDEHVARRIQEQVATYNAPDESFDGEQPITRARNRFFLRRLKEEMVDWNEGPLFKPRHTNTIGYDIEGPEEELYNAVTHYVRSRRREAQEKKNRNVALTLMVMQRRLASSIYAITRTLENRQKALQEVLRILNDPSRSEPEKRRLLKGGPGPDDPRDISEYEELSEADKEAADKRLLGQVLTTDPAKVQDELNEVQALHTQASALSDYREKKFTELLKVLDSSDVIRDEDQKLLIFTEHKDTLTRLSQRLVDKGYQIATIHGGMDVDERKKAQREFKQRAKIMVATDAAGEGINLQFCRYMINWDIPWNPNRLEQRMGRIHRYGQEGDVWVYNLVAQNTREGAVLHKVLKKLDVMREDMGSDRVFDVIDEWLENVELARLLEKAVDSEDSTQVEATTDDRLATASRDRADDLVALDKKSTLSSRLDMHAARDLRDQSDEHRLQPLFIQNFFARAWSAAGGTLRRDSAYQVWHIGNVPAALRALAQFRRWTLHPRYVDPITFDKALLSVASGAKLPESTRLMGPGHPLFDTLIEWCVENSREAFARGVLLHDPSAEVEKTVWLVRSTVVDGRIEARRRVADEQLLLVSGDGIALEATSPAYLLDCIPATQEQHAPGATDMSTTDIQAWVYEQQTQHQMEEVRVTRQTECSIRREYLESAFTDLILELQSQLNDLQRAQLFGEDVGDAIGRLSRHVEELKDRKTRRLAELDLMMKLHADLPQVLTIASVLPISESQGGGSAGIPTRRDDEVELIAMRVTIDYERKRGWSPLDVSKDGEHYDVRSEGPDGQKRFIEVKGRGDTGAIVLTAAERDKLSQLGERAWLYIVTACKSENPRLHTIQDPMAKLSPQMVYRDIQYVVQLQDWMASGAPVDGSGGYDT